jgi:hypothetical protein
MYTIVVWLNPEYSNTHVFECPKTWTKEQITEEVNNKYENQVFI